jgi:hypothetical protein
VAQRWSKDFGHVSTWQGHDGIVLASRAKTSLNSVAGAFITGSSDNSLKVSGKRRTVRSIDADARRSGMCRLA